MDLNYSESLSYFPSFSYLWQEEYRVKRGRIGEGRLREGGDKGAELNKGLLCEKRRENFK